MKDDLASVRVKEYVAARNALAKEWLVDVMSLFRRGTKASQTPKSDLPINLIIAKPIMPNSTKGVEILRAIFGGNGWLPDDAPKRNNLIKQNPQTY